MPLHLSPANGERRKSVVAMLSLRRGHGRHVLHFRSARRRAVAPVVCCGRAPSPLLFAVGARVRPCCLRRARACAPVVWTARGRLRLFPFAHAARGAERRAAHHVQSALDANGWTRSASPVRAPRGASPAKRRRAVRRSTAARSRSSRSGRGVGPRFPAGLLPRVSAGSRQRLVVAAGGAPTPPGCGFAKPARRRRTGPRFANASRSAPRWVRL